MNKLKLLLPALFLTLALGAQEIRQPNYAGDKAPRFKVLVYYTDAAEEAHVQFAHQAVAFFQKMTVGNGFIVDTATDLRPYGAEGLKAYSAILMVNEAPKDPSERALFEQYMENGGGWVGFHGAGYNDRTTGWPWLRNFIGGCYFNNNTWPPQPALVEVEGHDHPVTKNLPDSFVAPANEFYQWDPSPRTNPDILVFLSLSPKNFPMGLKDITYGGDFPIVWTNVRYRMIYLNFGHGDEEFTEAAQNLVLVNALRWIVSRDPSGNPFDK